MYLQKIKQKIHLLQMKSKWYYNYIIIDIKSEKIAQF